MKKLILLLVAILAVSAMFTVPALADEYDDYFYDDEDDYDYDSVTYEEDEPYSPEPVPYEEDEPYSPAPVIAYGSAVIFVDSYPSGATAYDLTTGQSTTTPGSFTIHEGTQYWGMSHTIKISKSGYYDYTGNTGSFEDGDEIYFTVTLEPISTTGAISVSSSPSGAAVYIDGIYHGVSPLTVSEDAGSHKVSVSKSGYDTYTGTATVNAGSTTQFYASLNQQVTNGYISVTSSPSGGDVYIDGNYKGDTPLTVLVSTGSHTVKVTRSGYSAYSKTVTVSSGSTTKVTASLLPNANSYINIFSYPSGAAVYADGVYYGNTQYSTSQNQNYLSVGPLTSGSHTISLTLDGYNKYSTSVSLGTNEVKSLSVTLTPNTPTVTTSTLYLSTEPSGSNVYIDNVYRGLTPVIFNDITPGSHIVLVQQAGYKDWSETINFQSGASVERTVVLSQNPTPVPTQSPAPFIALIAGLGAVALLTLRRE